MTRKRIDEIDVGQKVSQKISVGKYQPIYYAGASGDFNPIHIDSDFGKMVGLDGAILQGLCTMAFVAKTSVDFAGGDPGSLKRIKVRFAKPVRPDDDITVQGNVVSKEGKIVHADIEATNQDGELVITKAFADLEVD